MSGRLRLAAAILVLAACSSGADAPVTGASSTICGANFCLAYPGDWAVVEAGDDYAVFSHPAAPDAVVASVGQVDMRGLAAATDRTWPQPAAVAVEAFWELLGSDQASRDGVRRRADGSVSSEGAFRDGRLWHRLVPLDENEAVGVEVRAPNRSWRQHAAAFLDGLRTVAD